MRFTKPYVAGLTFAAIAPLLLLSVGAARPRTGDSNAELTQRVNALEKQVDQLQKQVRQLQSLARNPLHEFQVIPAPKLAPEVPLPTPWHELPGGTPQHSLPRSFNGSPYYVVPLAN